jgi:hypothetical protein
MYIHSNTLPSRRLANKGVVQAGVTKSCTVRVNEEIYCIRDGGKWKDCPNGSAVNDLVIAIEKLYRS